MLVVSAGSARAALQKANDRASAGRNQRHLGDDALARRKPRREICFDSVILRGGEIGA
jgi:hypothetical protein